MDAALAFSALLMGLAGSPHCVAMCGAACTGIAGRCGGDRPQRALLA
ncbi:MAG: sulfite exporter TauE/SafE family protein, partial [Rubrivivax sp.]|nr:sulfite exporter TauE/SafE family protein [Rubrivivax sp.]